MEFTVDSTALESTNYIVARIIHKELLVSTMGAFPPLQLVICSDFHLRESDILPLHLNNIATTNSINKWSGTLNPS